MSLSGNNPNPGRASIFETFHAPNFGGETFETSPLMLATKSYSLQPFLADPIMTNGSSVKSPVSVHLLSTKRLSQQETTEEEYVMEEEEEESSSENAEATLWMSCSPGRDLTDDELDEDCEKNSGWDVNETTEVCGSADGGKCNDDGKYDEDDDGLLLSEVASKQFIRYESIPSNAKYLKSNKPSKALTDKKTVTPTRRTAYSFFFREIRNVIRSKNPDANFHEISKIVANTWDHLTNDLKQTYCQRAEEFNSHYKAAAPAKLKSKKTKRSSSSSKHENELHFETFSESEDSLETSTFERVNASKDVNQHDDGDDVDASLTCLSISSKSKPSKEEMQERERKSKPVCIYTKCQKLAVDDPRWEYNYCSAQCVISHCKDVFKEWVANRKTAYCGT